MENAKLPTKRGLRAPRRACQGYAAILMVMVLSLSACTREPAEKRLRQQLATMQEAIAGRDARDFMDGVAADFSGNGGMGRDALHNLLRAQVLANAGIHVATGPLDVELQGDTARVRFQAVASGGSGRLALDRAQAYTIDSGWREEGGEWKLYYARWEPKL